MVERQLGRRTAAYKCVPTLYEGCRCCIRARGRHNAEDGCGKDESDAEHNMVNGPRNLRLQRAGPSRWRATIIHVRIRSAISGGGPDGSSSWRQAKIGISPSLRPPRSDGQSSQRSLWLDAPQLRSDDTTA